MSGSGIVLIVDDDARSVRALRVLLDIAGSPSVSASTGREALERAALMPPDAVILDLMLPDMTGIEVLTRMREWSQRPVLMVSGVDDDAAKIAALDAGADDYLTKPFSSGELLARLRAVRRRADSVGRREHIVRTGELEIDLARRRVLRRGGDVHLTPHEFALLAELARHLGRVVTHPSLLRAVWGPGSERETHYLRVFIAAIRRKLEDEPSRPRHLLTEVGVGYRLVADAPYLVNWPEVERSTAA